MRKLCDFKKKPKLNKTELNANYLICFMTVWLCQLKEQCVVNLFQHSINLGCFLPIEFKKPLLFKD